MKPSCAFCGHLAAWHAEMMDGVVLDGLCRLPCLCDRLVLDPASLVPDEPKLSAPLPLPEPMVRLDTLYVASVARPKRIVSFAEALRQSLGQQNIVLPPPKPAYHVWRAVVQAARHDLTYWWPEDYAQVPPRRWYERLWR